MRHRVFAVAFAVIAGFLGSGAVAAPTVTYSSGYATGVLNLSVDGTLFDVEFVGASYNTVFLTSSPYFLGNEPGAALAADALRDALNAESSVPQIGPRDPEVLWVPYADANNSDSDYFLAEQVGHDTSAGAWVRFADFLGERAVDYSDNNNTNNWYFAAFSPVPEPSSIALLGLGLAGLGLARRGKLN